MNCVIVVLWLNNHCLPLSKVVIIGKLHYTNKENILNNIMALGAKNNFMKQNVNIIHNKLKQLPWIKEVSVRKQWPDQLNINLVEYEPVAYWNNLFMLDHDGNIFRVIFHINSIPMLFGPKNSEKHVLNYYLSINPLLTAAKLKLKKVSFSKSNSWQLTLQDDINLILGRTNSHQRLKCFIKMYPIIIQQALTINKRISYVDFRYQSGFAVGWLPALIDYKSIHNH
ncbi:FtsQ-type POTRA domain-containing protein [Candidatus Palibaumannia cicadellinicola]|uniref:FtsQ-type POTRA domain-containing protein n=1 Tax=Candidatus Palibaumannia cicadellinicola TaxID=186490 RepID=UPI0021A579A8|nr:FtsQ-type POTRA domain-containing protein [Candidatus Baumannia cicadellinicola]